LAQSDVMCSLLTREAHITAKGNITHEVHITFRRGGTHRSKTKSTSYEVLFVLSRVDKKDANNVKFRR
jgi:hypothetical protein